MEDQILNIGWTTGNPAVRMLSNFAPTPFELLKEQYGSVEGFWQALKFEEGSKERRWIAEMQDGLRAKMAAKEKGSGEFFYFQGRRYNVGSASHHVLGEMALRAKFAQNSAARQCLIATGESLLTHELLSQWGKPIKDSRSWPRDVFCSQLMKIRGEIREDRFVESLSLPPADPERGEEKPSQLSFFG